MLACPKCNAYMYPGLKRGVELDFCSHCEGIWLDRGELAQVVGTNQDLPAEGQEKASSTKFPCPRCGLGLCTEHYQLDNPLLIDTCLRCKGVYLDKGELEKVETLSQQVQIVTPPDYRQNVAQRSLRNEALSAVYNTTDPAAKRPIIDRADFIGRVYSLLVATLFVTAGSAYYAIKSGIALTYFVPLLIAEFVVFIAALFGRRTKGLNMVLLFSYTALSGLTLGAVLQIYLGKGMANIVWQAAGLTALIFCGLTAYVFSSKRDFSWMGGTLFVALILLIVTGIVFVFLPNAFGMFIWSAISAFVFSGFILYDTSRIILKYDTEEIVSAVLDLYLDIVNLFLDLLRVLSYLQRR